METPDGFVWRADMCCAAEINGIWERGRICSDLTPSNTAEVGRPFRIDIILLRMLLFVV